MEDTIKRSYSNIDELMAALPDEIRTHCERVAEYTQLIYVQAVAEDIYPLDVRANARLKEEYRNAAYSIGLYHDAGKVMIPREYHRLREDFAPEEIAVYRKHVQDGSALVEKLIKPTKRFNAMELRFMEESILSHHERWNGTGFPSGTSKETIPLIARILAVADALDVFAINKISEHPFDDAIDYINDNAGTLFDPEVVAQLKPIKNKLRKVFNASISETKAIPVAENFIRRNASRSISLVYRPIVSRRGGKTFAYEAKMSFKDKNDWVEYEAIEPIIKKNKQLDRLGIYFLLEACDSINRFHLCSLEGEYVALKLPNGWLNRRGAAKDVAEAIKDEEIPPARLVLIVSADMWENKTKGLLENLEKVKEAGAGVMFSGMLPSSLKGYEHLVTDFRIESTNCEFLNDAEECEVVKNLKANGTRLIADGIGKRSMQTPLNKLAVTYSCGPLNGDYITEDRLVEIELASRG